MLKRLSSTAIGKGVIWFNPATLLILKEEYEKENKITPWPDSILIGQSITAHGSPSNQEKKIPFQNGSQVVLGVKEEADIILQLKPSRDLR